MLRGLLPYYSPSPRVLQEFRELQRRIQIWVGRAGAAGHIMVEAGASTDGAESSFKANQSRWDPMRRLDLRVWWSGLQDCEPVYLDDVLPAVADLAESSPDRHVQVSKRASALPSKPAPLLLLLVPPVPAPLAPALQPYKLMCYTKSAPVTPPSWPPNRRQPPANCFTHWRCSSSGKTPKLRAAQRCEATADPPPSLAPPFQTPLFLPWIARWFDPPRPA